MENKPLVSILMNCYNGEKYLKEAIDSIYAQTYENWEIIFVDNCSTDKSAEIAKSYDERLKYYKTEKNIPLYAARNFGLQYVTGEYLGFLDTDDIWLQDKLAIQIEYIINKNLDFVCTGAYDLHQSTNERYLKTLPNHVVTFTSMLERYEINIQTVLLNFKKIGNFKFDDRINIAGDYAFFIRYLKQDSLNAFFLEKPTVLYRIHDNNLSKASWTQWEKELEYIYENIEYLCSNYEKYRLHMYWDKRKYRNLLRLNNYSEARNVIKKYKNNSYKEFLMYSITYLPFLKFLVLPKGWQ